MWILCSTPGIAMSSRRWSRKSGKVVRFAMSRTATCRPVALPWEAIPNRDPTRRLEPVASAE